MKSVFLALDYMVGVADQAYATDALLAACDAIAEARRRRLLIIYSKVGFMPGHPDVAKGNRVFGSLIGTDRLVGDDSRLVADLVPLGDEILFDKKRFSAFSGNGLWTVLRAQQTSSVVLCGLSTSGVVLSTALELLDADIEVTVLSNACADAKYDVHNLVLNEILAKRTEVCTVAEWSTS